MKNTPEKFWARVKRGRANECWPWLGYVHPEGYGQTHWGNRKAFAHRIAAMITGLVKSPTAPRSTNRGRTIVLHTCDNKLCCNPRHLFIGTLRQNIHDCINKGRSRYACGEQHRLALFTATQVRAIRAQHKQGVSQRQLMRQYNAAQSVISRLVNRHSYREE
jgi:hypothetical protein